MHHLRVGQLTLGQKHKGDVQLGDKPGQFPLIVDGDIGIIGIAGERLGIIALGNERNLGGGKSTHVKFRVIDKESFEIVKVPARRTHDDAVKHDDQAAPQCPPG